MVKLCSHVRQGRVHSGQRHRTASHFQHTLLLDTRTCFASGEVYQATDEHVQKNLLLVTHDIPDAWRELLHGSTQLAELETHYLVTRKAAKGQQPRLRPSLRQFRDAVHGASLS